MDTGAAGLIYCRECGYDLRALESARCPECGLAFDRADPRTFQTRPDGYIVVRPHTHSRWLFWMFVVSAVLMLVGNVSLLPPVCRGFGSAFLCSSAGYLLFVGTMLIRAPRRLMARPGRSYRKTWCDHATAGMFASIVLLLCIFNLPLRAVGLAGSGIARASLDTGHEPPRENFGPIQVDRFWATGRSVMLTTSSGNELWWTDVREGSILPRVTPIDQSIFELARRVREFFRPTPRVVIPMGRGLRQLARATQPDH